jgi:hypothetical protein
MVCYILYYVTLCYVLLYVMLHYVMLYYVIMLMHLTRQKVSTCRNIRSSPQTLLSVLVSSSANCVLAANLARKILIDIFINKPLHLTRFCVNFVVSSTSYLYFMLLLCVVSVFLIVLFVIVLYVFLFYCPIALLLFACLCSFCCWPLCCLISI